MHENRKTTRAVAIFCTAFLVMAGCDGLLDVDLPDAVTEEALDNARTAALQVNSVSASFECAYSSFAASASGNEDNFQRYVGVAGGYSQYPSVPGGGSCDGDAYSTEWINPFLTARGQGYQTWNNISGYAISNQAELLAKVAFYNAAVLDVFGEFFCEFTIDSGTLMTPNQMLAVAEGWADSALAKLDAAVGVGGTLAYTVLQGTVTSDMRQAILGLRSRIRWASGDFPGAVSDAAQVSDGHMTWVLREDGEDRRNMVSSYQGGGGGTQAAGFLQGPVVLKDGTNTYGISELGSHPVNGTPYDAASGGWPSPVPFTGYIDLAIETATGRAVSDIGHPLTLADPGTVKDTRVEHFIGDTGGGPDYMIQKYDDLSDDIPLINWREMRLIEAEAAGPSSAGVDLVNRVRAADGLPEVQGAYRTLVEGDADRYDDMIIEERRRALWLEARFWSTKILKNEKLWFPRQVGDWVNPISTVALGGAVRMLMPTNEYEINPNLTLGDRGTGCPAGERPLFN